MNYQDLREYYRTLVTCHSELCWLYEKDLAEQSVRNLIRTFREEMQRVEDEIDKQDEKINGIRQETGYKIPKRELEVLRKIAYGDEKYIKVIEKIKEKYIQDKK